MRWDDVPDDTTLSISKKDVMKMKRGGIGTFFTGAACGAVLVIVLQSPSEDSDNKNPDKPSTDSSETATPNPSDD